MKSLERLALAAAVVALAGLLAARAAADEGPSLRLEDAMHLALTRNERARIADLESTIARAGVAPARAGATQAPSNVGAGTIQLTQPIVNEPAWPLYRQAKEVYEAQRYQTTDDKRTLAFDAARSFLAVLTSEAIL